MAESNEHQAQSIVATCLEHWGKREIYPATPQEISSLIGAGAEVIKINKDNGDGTFSHEVKYGELVFMASSQTRL